jgi:hypothetical protein
VTGAGGISRRRLILLGVSAAVGSATGCAVPPVARRRASASGPAAPPAAATLRVALAEDGRPISRLIYGVAHAGAAGLDATGARLHRWGGNPNTRYNWVRGSAWNAARDWEFRNYGDDPPGVAPGPSSAADAFVALTRSKGAEVFLTVPAMGWVAADADPAKRSTGVPPEGGTPLGEGGEAIRGYDPAANRAATSVRSRPRKGAPFDDRPDPGLGEVYQDEWLAHLVRRFGPADAGGVRYVAVDNEPDLWGETHTDVHPVRPSYDDLLDVFLAYATAIKDVDPTVQVAGPALSGWTALFDSPRDRGAGRSALGRVARRLPLGDGALPAPDRQAHGGEPFLSWWLDQVRRHDERAGRRTLDVLDVHWYPQASGVYTGGTPAPTDPATSALRLRSTRSLWDGGYADESWIGQPVRLVPRLREWIDRAYPGTRLAIGEWNWGADKTVNGALAIANVLGIFGREGVDLAAYWTAPEPGTPGALAFALYTSYDGRGSGFGDRALPATSSAPDDVAVYASREQASGTAVLVVVNQRPDATIPATVELAGTAGTEGRTARLYRYGAAEPGAILDLGERPLEGSRLRLDLPAYSASLIRIGAGAG